MNINPSMLFSVYDEVGELVAGKSLLQENFKKIKAVFEPKRNNPDAIIMVYGVYNAGKSTLINALIGREAAAVDDIPTTDSVDSYEWKRFRILDTPGIDAPIEHEIVTKGQMLKADVIIFVVNPVGVAEEAQTLRTLIELVEERKQVFLVFNEKSSLSEEDFIKLKDQTRARLQLLATERGLTQILKEIPIVKVNAKRALQSRIENKSHKEKMLASSGFPAFESELLSFLQNISDDVLYQPLKEKLAAFLDNFIKELENLSSAHLVKKYGNLLKEIEEEKHKTRLEIYADIARNRQEIYEESKVLFRSSPENIQTKVETLFHRKCTYVTKALEDSLECFVRKIRDDIDVLQAEMPNVDYAFNEFDISAVSISKPGEKNYPSSDTTLALSTSSSESIANMATQIAIQIQPSHIVTGLALAKDLLPSLMKGIGPKTMEKIAGSIVTKVPYIGPAITVVMALWDIFSSDANQDQLDRQIREQAMQRERALQEIDDLGKRLANDFESVMREAVAPLIDEFYLKISRQINILEENFSTEDRLNTKFIERASAIQQSLNAV